MSGWKRIISSWLAVGAMAILAGCPSVPMPPGNNGDSNGDQNGGDDNGTPVESKYVGSARCGDCHGDIYDSFMQTGHPFKLAAVVDAQAPEYPVTELAGLPDGLGWDDVAFVIGGFRYKYRVVDNDGFVVLGPSAQYNFPTQAFSGYNNDDDHTTPDGTPGPWASNIGRKPYSCGKCHTTAFDPDVENRRGLEGLVGDWEFEGVHCEECHGAGADHIAAVQSNDIPGALAAIVSVPDTDTTCGKCHTRSPDGVAASGGFVRHHEQYDEFSRSRHGQVMADGCSTCHDPHQPLFDAGRLAGIQALADADGNDSTLDTMDLPPGIISQCTDCHTDMTVAHAGPVSCRTCHMAFTTKTAVATGPNSGDIRSHAWLINTDASAPAFTDTDGNPVERDDPTAKFAALNEQGRPYITLDFACLRCHTDRDKAWASENSASIHGS